MYFKKDDHFFASSAIWIKDLKPLGVFNPCLDANELCFIHQRKPHQFRVSKLVSMVRELHMIAQYKH